MSHLPVAMARVLLCLLCISGAPTLHAATMDFAPYLPRANSVDAEYVVVTRDPLYDGYGQRLQAAMHRHAAWLHAYTEQHKGAKPLPYHPNFGVPEAQCPSCAVARWAWRTSGSCACRWASRSGWATPP